MAKSGGVLSRGLPLGTNHNFTCNCLQEDKASVIAKFNPSLPDRIELKQRCSGRNAIVEEYQNHHEDPGQYLLNYV